MTSILQITFMLLLFYQPFLNGQTNPKPDGDLSFEKLPIYLSGLKNIEAVLEENRDTIKYSLEKEALISSFFSSVEVCRKSLDLAAIKVEKIINAASERDETDREPSSQQPNINVTLNGDAQETNFHTLRVKTGSNSEYPDYFDHLERIFTALKHACSSLPSALPVVRNAKGRCTEEIARRLALSLSKWAERWFGSFEDKVNSFVTSCSRDVECKESLQKVIHYLMIMVKRSGRSFGGDTLEALQEFLEIVSSSKKTESSAKYFQKIAHQVRYLHNDFEDEDGSYDIAEQVVQSANGEARDVLNRLHLLSEYFKYPSKESILQVPSGEVETETSVVAASVHQSFLSVALGAGLIQEGWRDMKAQSEKFVKIASALSPSLLRVGGSAANFLSYNPSISRSANHPKSKPGNEESNANRILLSLRHPKRKNQYVVKEEDSLAAAVRHDACQPQFQSERPFENFTMTGNDWKFLISFLHEMKWELLFDLNQFFRDQNGHWNPSNAELLLNDPVSAKVPIIWQLGNEPNAYHHKFNWTLSPEEAARDYRTLYEELHKTDRKITGSGSIVGPDVTRPKHVQEPQKFDKDSMEFLERFLSLAGDQVDVLTFHQYYVNGRTATLEDFTSPDVLDVFPKQLAEVVAIRDQLVPSKQIWITETASAWGGGAPGLSDRFVGGFPWLDKLGAAALGGVSVIFRQTLYGGCYSLLDRHLEPRPDFWVSVVFKQLIGTGVLLPRTRLIPPSLRIYAHCLKTDHPLFKKGAIVLFGMNLSGKSERLELRGQGINGDSLKFLYKLSAPEENLRSKDVLLNGKVLRLSRKGDLPPFRPIEDRTRGLNFSAWSISFWVFVDANAKACY